MGYSSFCGFRLESKGIQGTKEGKVTYTNVRIGEALHCYQSSVRSLEEC